MYSKRLSQYFLPTLKEDPKEAEIPSHKLMIRAGMIRKLASGIYEFLPLGWRVVRKIENIIREEMDRIDGHELLMSTLQPKNLWDEMTGSGRWDLYGPELMRIKDRKKREFCLGPTHEEVITYLVDTNITSYKELPLLLYQFQMKFRDEIRPRFGVMRAREFYMKDAYSFDIDNAGCQKSYDDNFEAYNKIFKRCGLDFIAVEADTGNIGGKSSHEFMVIADAGEEEIVVCECGYGANTNVAEYKRGKEQPVSPEEDVLDTEEVHTPDVTTVEEVAQFLKASPERFIKTLLLHASGVGVVAAYIRGDHELNESALKKAIEKTTKNYGGSLRFLENEEIVKLGIAPGFSGPVGLNKETTGRVIHKYFDEAVFHIRNAIGGANKKDYHIKNINIERDVATKDDLYTGDFRKVTRGDDCPRCSKPLILKRGIEVGHTFYLGTKYSEKMRASFSDENGQHRPFVMGCYGIGVSRIAAAAIEQSHDEDGIIWPNSIAPFNLMMIQLSDETEEFCEKLYNKLSMKYEVLWDDRNESPGVKFKDARLIGIPLNIIIGKKYIEDGKLEIQYRKTGEKKYIQPEKLEEVLQNEKDN